jgi:hypothetical protein
VGHVAEDTRILELNSRFELVVHFRLCLLYPENITFSYYEMQSSIPKTQI